LRANKIYVKKELIADANFKIKIPPMFELELR